jgi:hypothetical protein
MAENAYRAVFPAPVKYGLPGLFIGDNITDFLEAYEEACRDLRVTADADKADRFGRWCERDIRKVIQRFEATDLATWTTLKAKIKKRWAIRDPDQKGDHRALDKLFNKPCDSSAESIFQQLEEVEKLLARVPETNYIRKRQEAVDRIWENFSVHVQNGFLIQLKDMNTEPKDMDFDDFRDWVQNSLYNGISAGPRFLKVILKDNRVPAATRRRRESLVTLPVPLSESARELAVASIPAQAPKASKSAPDQVDEMTQMLKEMRIHQQRMKSFLQHQGFALDLDDDDEEMHTFVQQNGRDFGGRPQHKKVLFNEDRPRQRRSSSSYSQYHDGPMACYYCGETGHTIPECRLCLSDQYHGLVHRERTTSWVLGHAGPRGPKTLIRINPEDAVAGLNKGVMWEVVRAYASSFPEADSYPPYQKWAADYEEKKGHPYQPNLILITDKSWLTLPHPSMNVLRHPPTAYSNLNRVSVRTETAEDASIYQYTESQQLNYYMDRADGGSTYLQKILPKSLPYRLVEDDEDSVVSDDEDHALATLTLETRAAKRARGEEDVTDQEPGDHGMTGTSAGDEAVEKNRVWVPTMPPKILQSGQTAKIASKAEEPLAPLRTDEDIVEVIRKAVTVKSSLTIEDLVRISPEYKDALLSYIAQIGSKKSVVEHWESAVPGRVSSEDKTPLTPPSSGNMSTNPPLRTNVNSVQEPDSAVQSETVTVPAIFGVTCDGQWGIASGSLWEKVALGLVNTATLGPEKEWMNTPITQLSLLQKAAVGAVTRFHALPTLYCQLDSPRGDKELALLDSGSECNCISFDMVQKYKLPLQSTKVMSRGLYESKAFLGETQARIVLGAQSVLCHFFVMAGDAGGHEILLGMPFVKDTRLTFDFSDDRLVAANIHMEDVIVKAFVVSKDTAKIRAH